MQNESCCPKQTETEEQVVQLDIEQPTEEQKQLEFLLNKKTRSEQRMDICKACPNLTQLTTCSQCNCFMTVKTRIYWAKCPIGKW